MTQSGERLIKAAEQAKQIATADIPGDVESAIKRFDRALRLYMLCGERGGDEEGTDTEYRAAKDHLRTTIAERLRSQWQQIETAPKDGTFVLVYSPSLDLNRRAFASWQGSEDDAEWYGVGDEGLRFASRMQKEPPTHWMPLPEPPKDK